MADTVVNTSKERSAMFASKLREIAARQARLREAGPGAKEPVDTFVPSKPLKTQR